MPPWARDANATPADRGRVSAFSGSCVHSKRSEGVVAAGDLKAPISIHRFPRSKLAGNPSLNTDRRFLRLVERPHARGFGSPFSRAPRPGWLCFLLSAPGPISPVSLSLTPSSPLGEVDRTGVAHLTWRVARKARGRSCHVSARSLARGAPEVRRWTRAPERLPGTPSFGVQDASSCAL
jgi:hypothetical protein